MARGYFMNIIGPFAFASFVGAHPEIIGAGKYHINISSASLSIYRFDAAPPPLAVSQALDPGTFRV